MKGAEICRRHSLSSPRTNPELGRDLSKMLVLLEITSYYGSGIRSSCIMTSQGRRTPGTLNSTVIWSASASYPQRFPSGEVCFCGPIAGRVFCFVLFVGFFLGGGCCFVFPHMDTFTETESVTSVHIPNSPFGFWFILFSSLSEETEKQRLSLIHRIVPRREVLRLD